MGEGESEEGKIGSVETLPRSQSHSVFGHTDVIGHRIDWWPTNRVQKHSGPLIGYTKSVHAVQTFTLLNCQRPDSQDPAFGAY